MSSLYKLCENVAELDILLALAQVSFIPHDEYPINLIEFDPITENCNQFNFPPFK